MRVACPSGGAGRKVPRRLAGDGRHRLDRHGGLLDHPRPFKGPDQVRRPPPFCRATTAFRLRRTSTRVPPPDNVDCPRTRWPQSPRIMVQRASLSIKRREDSASRPSPGPAGSGSARSTSRTPSQVPPQHGLSSNKMAPITSDCGATRLHAHQMALITSDCVPVQACPESGWPASSPSRTRGGTSSRRALPFR